MSRRQIIEFPLYYLSGGRLREVEKKIQTFNSKGGRSRFNTRVGRLQEVPNIVILLRNVCYFEEVVAEERWS